MASKRFVKYLTSAIALILCAAFVVKFGGPNILRQYISFGIGSCENIPILCMQPDEKIFLPEVNNEYRDTLVPQTFPKFSISAPKGFTLIQELIKRRYYKKRNKGDGSVIYLIYQEPQALIRLYPDVRKAGVKDNREFIRRMSYSNLSGVNTITDAFFVIMKSVFTPDVGNQGTVKMIKFELGDKAGYINYNLLKPENYFDCIVVDKQDNLFKLYIKDRGNRLDLNKLFTIISTLKVLD
ncbi:MAG: hypothetical protein PHP10_04130 [Candidatus Omnitrophica bacterium]|nr:hypothetical protein [Candidatus Omnitrophota bacterium]